MTADSSNIGYDRPTNEPEDLASSLRRRITLQEHLLTNEWATVATNVPASISATPRLIPPFMGGGADYLYDPIQLFNIRIRYRPGLVVYPHMQVLYTAQGRTRTFEISTVASPDEYRRSIVLTCRELADVGPVR